MTFLTIISNISGVAQVEKGFLGFLPSAKVFLENGKNISLIFLETSFEMEIEVAVFNSQGKIIPMNGRHVTFLKEKETISFINEQTIKK